MRAVIDRAIELKEQRLTVQGKTAEQIKAMQEAARLKKIEQMRAWRKRKSDYWKRYEY